MPPRMIKNYCKAYKNAKHVKYSCFNDTMPRNWRKLTMTTKVKVKSVSCSAVSNSLQPYGLAVRLLCPWSPPGKSTGMGCHALLQGISPIQGLNPGLLHCRQILYNLSHQGSPNNGCVLCAKSFLLCLTLCDLMNHSQAGHSCFQKEKKKKKMGGHGTAWELLIVPTVPTAHYSHSHWDEPQ